MLTRAEERGADHTLTGHCTVQRVALDEQRFPSAASMSFENIYGLYWILDVSTVVDSPYGQHSIDRHRCKQIVIAKGSE